MAGDTLSIKDSIVMEWMQNEIFPMARLITYPLLGLRTGDPKARTKEFKEKVEPMFKYFIEGNKFIGGSAPSVADYIVGLVFSFLLGDDQLGEKYPWLDRSLFGPYWVIADEQIKNYAASFQETVKSWPIVSRKLMQLLPSKALADADSEDRTSRPSRSRTQAPQLADRLLAVVTGCNKGIGREIAAQLIGQGVRVIAACRNPELGAAAAAELGAEFRQCDLADPESIDGFIAGLQAEHGQLDLLVNNGAIGFKARDPTPFAGQTGPTLRVNYWGTTRLTDGLLPMLRAAAGSRGTARVVNVASTLGKLRQVSPELQAAFSSDSLTREQLDGMMDRFEQAVQAGRHTAEGFGDSNYGMSKLGLIAYTMMLAREEPELRVNCCCPGWCATSGGLRSVADGAKNAMMLALVPKDGLTGVFIRDERPSQW